MRKKKAIGAFVYYGNRIYSPTGRKNIRAEKMRTAWAKAVDSGYYKKLPQGSIEADEIVYKKYIKI